MECSDERELAVNREFLGYDYYTDVITFDYSTAQTVNGELIYSRNCYYFVIFCYQYV